MASSAVVGGIILALIEGMGIWMNSALAAPPPGMEGGTELGPPTDDITAPPTSGGLGMIPTGLGAVGRRSTENVATVGGGGGSFDSGGHETTFSSGGEGSTPDEGGKGGGWWPFGGGS